MRHWSRLPLWAAVAIARSLDTMTGLHAGIKWPNDIWLNGRKTCGILIETKVTSESSGFVVVGIGLNVNQNTEDFPDDLRLIATSLRAECGKEFRLGDLAVEILRQLDQLLPGVEDYFDQILKECTLRSVLQGRIATVSTGEREYEGFVEGFDEDGSIRICSENGVVRSFGFGEVTRIRRSSE